MVTGRTSWVEQRRAADQVIAQIEGKLAKRSYDELLEKYGYGTLVAGMPLWLAVPPNDPFRAENAVDDFMTRTALGLEEVKRKVLKRLDCSVREVIVVWEATPQAWRAWRKARSAEYEDPANASVQNPLAVYLWGVLSESVEKVMPKTATSDSETSSMTLRLNVKTQQKAAGKGPYPEFVEGFKEISGILADKPMRLGEMFKQRVAMMLCGLLCFARIHGVGGLERWIARKLSVSHAWRARAVRRRARRYYRESRQRHRAPVRTRDCREVDGQLGRPPTRESTGRGIDGTVWRW